MKCNDCTCEDCKHENVKYCECCGGVHCVDCGEKWERPQITNPCVPYYGYTCEGCDFTACQHRDEQTSVANCMKE